MVLFRKILAHLFARTTSAVLAATGWKRKTVEANIRHVSRESSKSGMGDRELRGFLDQPETSYRKMLCHLAQHASELLFCFRTFKKLPAETSAYPCTVDGWDFELAEGAAPVLEKMREGGLFLTAHYGNYEAIGPWLCRLGIPLVASYIPVKPRWLNRILESRIRAVDGRSYSIDARTPREFLRLVDSGKLFCLLADQDSRIPSALDGAFLGQAVRDNPVPDFLLKHRPQTPIYVCTLEEREEGPRAEQSPRTAEQCPRTAGQSLKIAEQDSRNAGAVRDAQPNVQNTRQEERGRRRIRILHAEALPAGSSVHQQFNAWLEERIRENPALWYGWTHRRFYSVRPEIYKQ